MTFHVGDANLEPVVGTVVGVLQTEGLRLVGGRLSPPGLEAVEKLLPAGLSAGLRGIIRMRENNSESNGNVRNRSQRGEDQLSHQYPVITTLQRLNLLFIAKY